MGTWFAASTGRVLCGAGVGIREGGGCVSRRDARDRRGSRKGERGEREARAAQRRSGAAAQRRSGAQALITLPSNRLVFRKPSKARNPNKIKIQTPTLRTSYSNSITLDGGHRWLVGKPLHVAFQRTISKLHPRSPNSVASGANLGFVTCFPTSHL